MNLAAILDGVVSHALSLGLFERVNTHEPKAKPGDGLTAAIWVQSIGPVPAGSGLSLTTAQVVFHVRLYSNMLAEPQDEIDPTVMNAVDALFAAYSGDFELGGSVRNVDLLGQAGVSLSALAGYVNLSGGMYRVMEITLPLIINDAWAQEA